MWFVQGLDVSGSELAHEELEGAETSVVVCLGPGQTKNRVVFVFEVDSVRQKRAPRIIYVRIPRRRPPSCRRNLSLILGWILPPARVSPQGIANAAGMAAAAKMAAAQFNTDKHTIFSNHIVALCGDGCMQVRAGELVWNRILRM